MIAIRSTYVAVPESEATTAKRLGVLRIQTGATQYRREACEQAAPPRSRLEGPAVSISAGMMNPLPGW